MPRILVVEDDRLAAELLATTLAALGHEVVGVVASGFEAIRAADLHAPDLVLMDVQLHGDIDGVQAAVHLRTRRDVPVVFLTADAAPGTLHRAARAHPFGWLSKPFRDGDLANAIAIALDRHAEHRRAETQRGALETILARVHDGVVAVDDAHRVLFVNREAERATGVPAAAAIGRPIGELLRLHQPGGAPIGREALRELVEGRPAVAEVVLAGAAGELPVEIAVVPLRGGAHAALVLRDLSELRRLRGALVGAHRLAAGGPLARGVAAELTNPLAACLANQGFALAELAMLEESLAADGSPVRERVAEVRAALEDARAGAERIRDVLRALNEIASPRPGGKVDLAAAVESAVRTSEARVRRAAQLEVDAGGVGPEIAGDRLQLAGLVAILLRGAAARFARPGAPANRVAVRCGTAPDGGATVTVEDTAEPPLAPEDDPFASDPDAAGDAADTCRAVLEAHHGRVAVEPRADGGTRVSLTFPAAPRRPA